MQNSCEACDIRVYPTKTRKAVCLNEEFFFKVLLVLIWTNSVLVSYFRQTLLLLGFGDFTEIIIACLFVFAVILSIPYFVNHLKLRDILVYAVGVLFYVASSFGLSISAEYLNEKMANVLFMVLPLYLIGICLGGDKHLKLFIFWSKICLLLTLIHFLVFGFVPEDGFDSNMGQAYRILQHLPFVCLGAFQSKRPLDFISLLIGLLLLLACGNRGSVLSFACFVAFLLIFFERNLLKKVMLILSIVLAVLLFFIFSEHILTAFASFFDKIGFSTRTFDMFFSGQIKFDSGRSEIIQSVLNALENNCYRGFGLAADRSFTETGVYCHNIVVEFWISFGAIFGTLMLAVFVFFLFKGYFVSPLDGKMILVAFVFNGGLFKLLFTSSYLIEFLFFMLLGFCIGTIRKAHETKRRNHFNGKRRFKVSLWNKL